MKIEFDHLMFVEMQVGGPKRRWSCMTVAHRERLGAVAWYPLWNQYCYIPSGAAAYSATSLREIVEFMDQLKEKKHDRKDNTGSESESEKDPNPPLGDGESTPASAAEQPAVKQFPKPGAGKPAANRTAKGSKSSKR